MDYRRSTARGCTGGEVLRPPGHFGRSLAAILLLLASARADVAGTSDWPRTARREIVEELLADLRAVHHSSDGGGSARLLSVPLARAGKRGAWKVQYEAGPLGVAAGGSVQLQVSPFWGWSEPQTVDPEGSGYTTITTDAPGTTLTIRSCGQGCIGAEIGERGLPQGAHIVFFYGAGPAGALADRYAEKGESFRVWVDGDGDGTRRLVAQNPTLAVEAGEPARILAVVPSTAAVGERVALAITLLDAVGNGPVPFTGEIAVRGPPEMEFPPSIALGAADRGHKRVYVKARAPGIYRFQLEVRGGIRCVSNPIQVTRGKPRAIRWADLHGHTNISDGTGSLDDYYVYAREVAALDVAAVTDHDHWGLGFLDQRPKLWRQIQEAADRHYHPGEFVTITGYEWTSWIYGHRHVLYFSGPTKLLSSLDPDTDTPSELWNALRRNKSKALTVPHHPAGGPVAIDWSMPPDPLFEPVVEIVSVHGSSECEGAPGQIYQPQPSHFVCDALKKGYRLGIIGSGDGHDGHPGLSHLNGPSGGLAALIDAELTREGVLQALRSRRVYATNGERMILEFRLGPHPMGSLVKRGAQTTQEAYLGRVVGTAPIVSVELVKNGHVIASVAGDGRLEASLGYDDPLLERGDYAYLRATQEGGGMAWSSPIWID